MRRKRRGLRATTHPGECRVWSRPWRRLTSNGLERRHILILLLGLLPSSRPIPLSRAVLLLRCSILLSARSTAGLPSSARPLMPSSAGPIHLRLLLLLLLAWGEVDIYATVPSGLAGPTLFCKGFVQPFAVGTTPRVVG